MKKTKTMRSEQDAQLAQRHGCDPRTIARWRADDAPLDDDKAMRTWLAGRKNLPAGTLALLMEQRRTERETREKAVSAAPPDATGAAAALARLERAEEEAHRALRAAEAGGDPLEQRVALKQWLTIADQLLSFDHRVQLGRRALDMVPRAQVEDALRFLGWCLHVGSEQTANGLVMEIIGEQSLPRIADLLRRCSYNVALLGYASAYADKIPPWIIEAVSSHFLDATTVTRPDLLQAAAVIREAIDELTPRTIAAVTQ